MVCRLILCLLAFCTASSFSAAKADILDIAIEIVQPELKTARPVLECIISGGAVYDCALAQGKAELAADPRFQDIMEVYGYANKEEWALLISKVGVTAACTVFNIPAKEIVCDTFAAEVVEVGAAIIEAHAVVASEAGSAVVSFVSESAELVTCAVGYSCPSNQPDPNTFIARINGHDSGQVLTKFNLDKIWTDCYATRVEEGIRSRISDATSFKVMSAVPMTKHPAQYYWRDSEALGVTCISQMMTEQGYSYEDKQYTYYFFAFEPYAAQMNPRWRDMVFAATAELLENEAAVFLSVSDSWLKLRSIVIAQDTWDKLPALKQKGVVNAELAECIRAVELPAAAVSSWGTNAAAVGDLTVLEGVQSADWPAKILGWCEREYMPTLAAKKQERRDAYNRAIELGCTKSAKGLVCPPVPPESFVLIANSPMGNCEFAYSGRPGNCVASERIALPAEQAPTDSTRQLLPSLRVITPGALTDLPPVVEVAPEREPERDTEVKPLPMIRTPNRS